MQVILKIKFHSATLKTYKTVHSSVRRMEKHMELKLEQMVTERRNENTMNLDMMSPLEIVTDMNQEDLLIPAAIKPHLETIAKVVTWGTESVTNGGRIFYMGAGTSGRLGVLDASECPPTFGVSPDVVIGLIAGGQKAFTQAVEGAEDNYDLGISDLKEHGLTGKDLVIGLAASGRTPYVLGGLEYAKSIGCHTAAITCNADSVLSKAAEAGIDIVIGPEVLTGSTRLKAGTAQKMVLNMISTAVMVGAGKVYENLMVDVQQSNEKLRVRARRIVRLATEADDETIEKCLEAANGSCKVAITMILGGCDAEEARNRLEQANGHVRNAVK